MPSPTEPVSSETLSLPTKENVENMDTSQEENVPNVDPDDGDEVTNLDNTKEPQPQPQPQSQSNPQQEQQQSTTSVTTTTTTNTINTTNTTTSSPSHMTDITNEVPNANAASTSLTSTTSPPTTQDISQDISQDTPQDPLKSPPPKRKYSKKPTNKDDQPRRRTRNTAKVATSPQDDEQSLVNRRTSSATPSRRGTSSTNIEQIERQLPSKEGINQSNISERFIEFIMYCNPLAPENLDKVALVRSFNAVPKSDGKVFQTWTLYQLVDKHYAGEIRTWTKLAQKLGVVRTPEASPQKIQQYAVRLKKWMASVHVDAYFDYLLSRPNDYYQIPQKNPTDASDDESDVVLKLIKRAGSKRQKRKYTRRNTNASNTSANDDGTNPEGISRGNTTELDDEAHSESEDADEGADKHRGKRVRASYSDGSEDDKDPWADEMDVDDDDEEQERPDSTGTNHRRKSVVQVGLCPNWVKDDVLKEEESENVVGGRLGVREEANPENDSSRYYRQYPSQFALIEPKNGSNIPTPNPSPTTLPVMSLSSGNNITGSKRVLSQSGATGGAGTQLRWRISTGPVHTVKSLADESYLTTSPSSYQKDQSKKKQEPIQSLPPGQTVLDLRQQPVAPSPQIVRARNLNEQQQQQQFTDGKNYAEMLLPTTLPNNDKDTISILHKNLIRAVGMLEDSQRKIKMLDDIVHQRDDDVRQRVVRALKNEVNSVIERFQ